MQGVIPLLVAAPRIFCPMTRPHTGIRTIIHLAEGVDLHKKRIAAEFKMINGILKQLLFLRDRVLLPLALQIYLALALQVGVWSAPYDKSHNDEGES